MAELFFLRDGSGKDRASNAHEVSIDVANSVAKDHGTRFGAGPITINGEVPARWPQQFKYVTVRIGANEVGDEFDREGYYLFQGLSPEDALEKFGLSEIKDL